MNPIPASDAALPPEDLALLRNHSFDELSVGDSASLERTLSTQDLRLFAALSGASVADAAAAGPGVQSPADEDDTALIAHGMWAGMLLASVLGTRLPGPGTTLVGQTLRFLAPLATGSPCAWRCWPGRPSSARSRWPWPAPTSTARP
jgi:phosphate acetyltransferase